MFGWGPYCEPVHMRTRRHGRDVLDLVLAAADLHAPAVERVDQQIVAEGADAEDQACESVDRERDGRAQRRSQVFPRAEHEEAKQDDLEVHQGDEEGCHDEEAEPVPEQEAAEEVHAEPVEGDGQQFLQEVRFQHQ